MYIVINLYYVATSKFLKQFKKNYHCEKLKKSSLQLIIVSHNSNSKDFFCKN